MRPTARGYGLLGAGVLLLGAGSGLGYRELAALGAAALVTVAGGLAFVAWRPRLRVDRAADPDRVSRGEASVMTLGIANASRICGVSLVARDRLTFRVGGGPGARVGAGPGMVPVPLLRLRAGGVTGATYAIPTGRRGVLDVGPLEVARTDPLGLVSAVRTYGEPVRVWVRPRAYGIAAVPVGLSRSMDGRVDRVPQGTITFSALREYVIGDDLRHVHWRTSARVGELMVREHVDTSLPRVVVLLDDRAPAHSWVASGDQAAFGSAASGSAASGSAASGSATFGSATFESACEAAASVLVAAFQQDLRVEVQFVTNPASAARPLTRGLDAAQVSAQLDLLAEASLGEGDLAAAVERLRVRRVGDTLLYLTGSANPADLGLVASLRGAYPSIIVARFGDPRKAGSTALGEDPSKIDLTEAVPVGVESGLNTTRGLLVVGARDGADFAAVWDGIRAW